MKKYEQLEAQVAELYDITCGHSVDWKKINLSLLSGLIADIQKEVKSLKDEEKSEMAKDIKETIETNFLPSLVREYAIKVLNGDLKSLVYAFLWYQTPPRK
jgi:hypothetical protein